MVDEKEGDRVRSWFKPKKAQKKRALHFAVDADAKNFEDFMGDIFELGCDAYENGKRVKHPPAGRK